WLQRSNRTDDATAVWEDLEAWFQLLFETHTRAPVIAVVPSVHRGQSWLVAAAVILDAASFWLSALDAKDHASADLCRKSGVNALMSIIVQHSGKRIRNAGGLTAEPLSQAAYETFCRQIAAAGAPIKTDTNAAWRSFTSLRQEYEHLLPQLAEGLLVPLASGALLPLSDRQREPTG